MSSNTKTIHDSADTIPRSPSAYRPTCHFTSRFHDRYSDAPPRHLDAEIVATCIREGTASRSTREKWELRETFDGVTYVLVVNPTEKTVVSGYPESVSDDAGDNGRWTEGELDDIRSFLQYETSPR